MTVILVIHTVLCDLNTIRVSGSHIYKYKGNTMPNILFIIKHKRKMTIATFNKDATSDESTIVNLMIIANGYIKSFF